MKAGLDLELPMADKIKEGALLYSGGKSYWEKKLLIKRVVQGSLVNENVLI